VLIKHTNKTTHGRTNKSHGMPGFRSFGWDIGFMFSLSFHRVESVALAARGHQSHLTRVPLACVKLVRHNSATSMANELLSKEPIIRLSIFLGIFALMSVWE
jgi:hypothetical protein